MIKVKSGYAKLIGTTYAGAANHVLLSNGGDLEYSTASKANTIVLRNANHCIYTHLLENADNALTLNGKAGVLIKFNNTDTNSVILTTSSFKPYDLANGLIDLGLPGAKWRTIHGLTGSFTNAVYASGFIRTGSTNNHVLLGGGGHKAVSDFLLKAGDTMTGYLGVRNRYLIKPVAESVNNASSVTGAITITLPENLGPTMLSMWVDVYNYDNNKSFSAHICGYAYPVDSSHTSYSWHSTSAVIYGLQHHSVRFGYTGTNFVIYIGEANTVWKYPQVIVRDVILGHSPNYSNWIKDWTISFSTTFLNLTSSVTNGVLTTLNYSDIINNLYYTKTESDNRYYTKTESDNKYVTLTTAQRISGQKTFTSPVIIECANDKKLIFNNTDGEKYSNISFRENNTEYALFFASPEGFVFGNPLKSTELVLGTRFVSTVAQGTAPLQVTSTTVVPNLNADMLDGLHEGKFMRNYEYAPTDLNTATRSGVFKIKGHSAHLNLPGAEAAWGLLLVLHSTGDTIAQLSFCYGDSGKIWARSGNPSNVGGSGSWNSWVQLARVTDNVASATKLTTSAGSALNPIYFKDGKPVAGLYTFGNLNGNAATFTSFPGYNRLVELGYNTEANKNNTSEYLKGLCKWLIATYPNGGNFIGTANPNSDGFCHILVYSSGNGVKDGLPRYCSGAYYPLLGNIITFNISEYVWNIISLYIDNSSNLLIGGVKHFNAQPLFKVAQGTSPFLVTSSTLVTKLNADLLDGHHESNFFRNRGAYSTSIENIPNANLLILDNNLSGCWYTPNTDTSVGGGNLVQFCTGENNATKYMLFYSLWDSDLYWRNSLDSTLNNRVWRQIIDTKNYTRLVTKIGTATVGSSAHPIYLNAGVPTRCGDTLDVNISGSATRATYLLTTTNNYNSNTTYADALKKYFDAEKANIPRNKLISITSNVSGQTPHYFGYFHTGFDTNPYGGFYVAHYNQPWYVGISNGSYTLYKLLTNANFSEFLNSLYVQSLSTSGNYLTWTKNGVTNNITVPFATDSSRLRGSIISDVNNPSFHDEEGNRMVYDRYSDSASNKPVSVNNANSVLTLYKSKHSTSYLYFSQLAFPDSDRVYYRYRSGGSLGSWRTFAYLTDHLSNPYSLTLQINGTSQVIYDGSSAKTFNVNLGSYVTTNTALTISGVKTFSSLIKSTVALGTAPFVVNSSTVVAKLNADLLDGYEASSFYRIRNVISTSSSKADANSVWADAIQHDYRWSNAPSSDSSIASLLDLSYSSDWRTLLFVNHSGNSAIFVRSRYSGTTWSSWNRLAYTTDIPSSLKNPYSLTLQVNGSTLATYDGSSSKTFNVSLPSSLKNPYSLTLLVNGSTLATYDGSSSKTFNINLPSSVDPTDYYWANVKVSSSSSISTLPEFSRVIANNTSDRAFYANGGYYSYGDSENAFTVFNDGYTYTKIAGKIDSSASGNTNVISRYLVEYDTSSVSIDVIKSSSSTKSISGLSFKFNGTEKALINSAGGFYSSGFHHLSKDSDSYVLLAGGGYKALSSLGSTINNAGHDTRGIYISNGTAYTMKHLLEADVLYSSTAGQLAYYSKGGSETSEISPFAGNVGGDIQPIYIKGGVPTASTAKIGSATKPIYLDSGVIKMCTHILSASVAGGGSAGDLVGFIGDGLIGAYSKGPVGNPTKGIYLNGAVPTEMDCVLLSNVMRPTLGTLDSALACYDVANNSISPLIGFIGGPGNPIYSENGVLKSCTHRLDASVEGASNHGQIAFYNSYGHVAPYEDSLGNNSHPMYLDQGVPISCSGSLIRYYASYCLTCNNASTVSWTKEFGNHNYITSVSKLETGHYYVYVSFPSGYNMTGTFIFVLGAYGMNTGSGGTSTKTLYATVYRSSSSRYEITTSDDETLNDGRIYVYMFNIGT